MNNDQKWFVIYWLNGTFSTLQGQDIGDAFTKAGHAASAIHAIDHYSEGLKLTATYDKEQRNWVSLKEPYQFFTVYLFDGRREVVTGLDIKHALKNAGHEDHLLVTISWWEEGITDSYLYFEHDKLWIAREELAQLYK